MALMRDGYENSNTKMIVPHHENVVLFPFVAKFHLSPLKSASCPYINYESVMKWSDACSDQVLIIYSMESRTRGSEAIKPIY